MIEVLVRSVETGSFFGAARPTKRSPVHQPAADHHPCPGFMKNDPLHRIKLTLPWRHSNHAARVNITCSAARPDSGGAEVDFFGVILAIDSWRQQPHDMHSGETTILCKTPNFRCLAQLLRYLLYQFGYDMAEPMQCFCRAVWLTARLAYWMSFLRFSTCQMVSGSDPCGFQRWTTNTSELRLG